MTQPPVGPATYRRPGSLGVVLGVGVAVVTAATVLVFFGVGRWLVVQDKLEKAEAIVILSGRVPMRAIEAARLYGAGYATQVWLTRPEQPAADLQNMGIAYAGEEVYNARILAHEGVPVSAIRVLGPAINNTADELSEVSSELAKENATVVILVTTKAHTRRVRTLWKAITGGRIRAIVRAARDDPFDAKHWWRTTGDSLDTVREVLGLLNAWAGLPLRPSDK
jgi:uncharacterized SAM-binding protein YcdF (DUF218 family)